VKEAHGWERATPMALMGCVIGEKSAIAVARSQRKSMIDKHLHWSSV